MATDEEVTHHRTLIPFDPSKEDYSPRWRPEPVDLRKWIYVGYQVLGAMSREVSMRKKPDQRFEDFATPWEQEWSYLYKFHGKFFPIVDEQWFVVGHYGALNGDPECDLLVPIWYDPREVPYDGHYPWPPPKDWVVDETPVDSAEFAVRHGIPVFVGSGRKPPPGFKSGDFLSSGYIYQVACLPDGTVTSAARKVNDGLETPWFSPLDLLDIAKVIVFLGAKVGSKLTKVLLNKLLKGELRDVFEGATEKVAKKFREMLARQAAKREGGTLFKGLPLRRGYDLRMGIPEEHLRAMVEAAKEAQVIAIFRANKKAAIPLIRQGAHGKPMWAKFKTSSETGVLTAKNAEERMIAFRNGHFVVHADQVAKGTARRIEMRAGKEVITEVKLNGTWKVEEGQVIAPDGKPVVGDYDLLGVAPIKSPGSSVAGVPEDVATGDWSGPWVKKYGDAVNKRLDKPRVLHGAQDQYGGNPKYVGLTDDTAYAVFPDGRTFIMEGRKAQEEFYAALSRQPKSPGLAPIGKPGWKPTIVK